MLMTANRVCYGRDYWLRPRISHWRWTVLGLPATTTTGPPLAGSGLSAKSERPAPELWADGLESPRAAHYALIMGERRQVFERELEAIEAKVIELFAMVAEDLPGATSALLSGNSEMIKSLTEREQAIDALYLEIEGMVNREILLQAPVASDLRFLLSVLRVVPELERSHDLVIEIATRANHILSDDLSPRCRGLVEQMGSLASGMWRQAVDSWYQRDRSVAAKLDERDDEMDELYASLIAELASGGMTLPVTMEMTLVARLYERLGDHAVNIARRVAYLAGSHSLPGAADL
jgi:phosphate transport system protein